jgi:phosphomannomutase
MSKAGINIVPLFLERDGNFPNHHPNPMLSVNREHAKQAVLDTGANMAFLFDGDADRVVILDSRGEMVVSGIICSIIADALLRANPGKTIAGNAVISHSLKDLVEDR